MLLSPAVHEPGRLKGAQGFFVLFRPDSSTQHGMAYLDDGSNASIEKTIARVSLSIAPHPGTEA